MKKLTKQQLIKTGITEEQANKVIELQNSTNRKYYFLEYTKNKEQIEEKIQTFKLNYYFFKIGIDEITKREKGQLLNNGYKYRTLKESNQYLFFLDSKASKIESGMGIQYFSILKIKEWASKDKDRQIIYDHYRLYEYTLKQYKDIFKSAKNRANKINDFFENLLKDDKLKDKVKDLKIKYKLQTNKEILLSLYTVDDIATIWDKGIYE